MNKKQPIILLKDIIKEYRSLDVITPVLQGVSLSVYPGDFIAITGPSGSGKSTMMNILGLLDVPTSGTYILNGEKTTGLSEDKLAFIRNKEIGFVFQSFNLLTRSSALENVVLPAIYAGSNKKIRNDRAIELLSQVGLKERMYNRPNQLSGGQQQRVAIARALMNNPEIILADEPTGNLDTKSGNDVMNILKTLNKEGKTIVLITHELDIASQAKKVIHFRDGKII
ncbi:MAG TPA: ABC transporter ATP-binding protein [Patescibacteria group bacterium]